MACRHGAFFMRKGNLCYNCRMELTEEEINALHWWCNWTASDTDRRVAYSAQMESEGEIDKGSYAREKALMEKVFAIFERLGKPLRRD